MDNREYNAAIYNAIYNDIEWGSPKLTKQYIDTQTKYIPFSDKDLKRWEDFKVKFPNQAHTYQYAANELGVPVQALFREGNDVVGAYLESIPYTDNIMHRFYDDPRGLDKSIPRTKVSKEQMLKASKTLGQTAKNILGALDNKVFGFYGDINDMLMLQGAPQYNQERALQYLQRNNPELLERYDIDTNTWRD